MIGPRWTAGAFVVAAFLLVSMGGAILAAPLTLPVMYVGVRRHPTHPFRVIGGLLSALTVGEIVWAGVYFTLGESEPWIWVLPLIGALAVVLAYARPSTEGSRRGAVAIEARTTTL